jgi:hypothetical protein
VFDFKKGLLGEEHRDVLITMKAQVMTIAKSGRRKEAETLL